MYVCRCDRQHRKRKRGKPLKYLLGEWYLPRRKAYPVGKFYYSEGKDVHRAGFVVQYLVELCGNVFVRPKQRSYKYRSIANKNVHTPIRRPLCMAARMRFVGSFFVSFRSAKNSPTASFLNFFLIVSSMRRLWVGSATY